MYELLFWKYKEEVYLNNHEVYERLLEDQIIEGLEELPITIILSRISNVFSKWEKIDSMSFKNTMGVGAFHIKTTNQSIVISCYGTKGTDMDKLCQIMDEFKCPLYDPQVPIRYDEFAE
ncbi:hypothetical protein [Flavobacterium oreochromis]|uniref:Uncharacterized protein n=2 Tax=Flavobacterium TaxID=237 RepID=A0A246G812_9FLAO|nr:hypothetical protein [Flavobacterium oreochromis]OWP74826.1 hypothetical protein BWK62_13360 [Flavobacterium oreochromis]OWP77746.1 hypothetical protein BWG23_04100 [Flavobacterium oreochromis]POR25114.1 hypothetical protein BWK58_07270 [Flavobacterium columnare]QYS85764.1 hypothetical protein JJC03_11490 [Flavobacterium oreochromis]